MPNSYSHTIYKQYVDMIKTEEGKKAMAAEELQDEIVDQMT